MPMSTKTPETAAFIRDMSGELADMADSAYLPFLGYLLRLAKAEANNVSQSKPAAKAAMPGAHSFKA
jgi:hypothetical protein